MRKLGLLQLILAATFVFFAVHAWTENAGQQTQSNPDKKEAAAPADAKKTGQPTQTAASPQSQPADDDEIPRLIEVTPKSKNTITIATPPGLQETNQRRHNTYSRISKKAKDDVIETRTSAEKAETASTDAKNEADSEKPPRK